jgi:hypothetical protein
MKAIIGKEGGLAALTAGTLVATFGVAPAVAVVVAAILLKVVFEPAGDEICKEWARSLTSSTRRRKRSP